MCIRDRFIPGFLSPAYKTVFREGSLRYCTGLLEPNGHDVLRQLLPDQDAYRKCLMLREPHGPFTTADDSKYFDIALMKSALKNIGPGGAVDRSAVSYTHLTSSTTTAPPMRMGRRNPMSTTTGVMAALRP